MDEKEILKILKAVANKNRFAILKHLHKNPNLSVGDIAESIDYPFRSVSKDLSILRKINLVQSKNYYSKRLYSINKLIFPKELLTLLES